MGRAIVLRLLEEGAQVVFGDLNEITSQETIKAAEAGGLNDNLRFALADVAEEADVKAMVDLALSQFGRLDCMVNNAGVGGVIGPLTETPVEDWDYTMNALLRSVFLGIKHAGQIMKQQGGGGAMVNTASVAGLSGGSGPQAYSAAKAGVINLTRSAALELAPYRIRVNAICPGAILTPLAIRGGGDPEERAHAFAKLQPMPITGRPSHIAAAVLFLASDEAEFITGEALVVDGGLTARGPGLIVRPDRPPPWEGAAGVNRGSTGLESTAHVAGSPDAPR